MHTRRGRPTGLELARRQRELIGRLVAGDTLRVAAKAVGMDPGSVLTMLDEPEFFAVVAALRDGRAQVAAVTVAPQVEAQAA